MPQQAHFLRNCGIGISLTGRTSVGKSSVLNGILGLLPRDGRAAAVGVGETTMKITAYSNETLYPHMLLHDLPGYGTPRHAMSTYIV